MPIEPFYRDLGRRIQQSRVLRKLTQENLGDRLSPTMTRASIANIETGKQRVLAHTLVQLASILNVPLDALAPSGAKGEGSQPTMNAVEAELAEKLPDLLPEQRQAFLAKLKILE